VFIYSPPPPPPGGHADKRGDRLGGETASVWNQMSWVQTGAVMRACTKHYKTMEPFDILN
jgi:hypothetical protein